jgi:hypothetical protein
MAPAAPLAPPLLAVVNKAILYVALELEAYIINPIDVFKISLYTHLKNKTLMHALGQMCPSQLCSTFITNIARWCLTTIPCSSDLDSVWPRLS